MGQAYAALLHGDGAVDLGGQPFIKYWVAHVVTLPARAAILDDLHPRRILHVAWIALGYPQDAGDGVIRPTYGNGRWLDMEDWSQAIPSEEWGAQYIRWHVGPGGSVQFAAYD